MRTLMTSLAVLAFLMCLTPVAAAIDDDSMVWSITIKHEDKESNLMGQSTAASGEPCSFMVYFGKGHQGVRTGFDPSMNPFEPWQTESESRVRSRSRTKEVLTSMPDLLVVLTFVVTPEGNDYIRVQKTTSRWELIDEPPPYDYRFHTDAVESEVGVGDAWQFLAGTGPDGKDYYLELTIESAGRGRRTVVKPRRHVAPLRLRYRLLTPNKSGKADYETEWRVLLSPDEKTQARELYAPITIPGIDSSLLNVDIKLNNVVLQQVGARNQYEINAQFELKRWLLIDIKPTPDTTQMQLSQMISSSYNHAIHLRPNKKVRIEIPKIESGKYNLDAREIIEIEPVEDEEPR